MPLKRTVHLLPDGADHLEQFQWLAQEVQRAGAASQRVEAEVVRLGKDYERIRELDCFDAPGRAEVDRLKEAIDMKKRPAEGARRLDTPRFDVRELRGRHWVTRPRPHVDRVGSAWLIKRFIDPEATFLFAEPGDFPPDTIPFAPPRGGPEP